ncbi:hypothetical protein ANCDUO_07839 [Ancylostoma duodenale]|uniref:Uncharacterized protein n=1 Tax=Ancylostoma duodenale TaxID=51022 RepID=A0A0C2GXN6_9BILA|nr:hypothetical protein ANCDUO_07839 [Ancylostoma duodenale]
MWWYIKGATGAPAPEETEFAPLVFFDETHHGIAALCLCIHSCQLEERHKPGKSRSARISRNRNRSCEKKSGLLMVHKFSVRTSFVLVQTKIYEEKGVYCAAYRPNYEYYCVGIWSGEKLTMSSRHLQRIKKFCPTYKHHCISHK